MSKLTKAKELGITEFPYKEFITDNNDSELLTYYESSIGNWYKSSYDKDFNYIKFENSQGYWRETTFDEANRENSFKNSLGFWWSREFGEDGKLISYEDNDGNYWTKEMDIPNPYISW